MNLIKTRHLTPLIILSSILILGAIINCIGPGEGWGYVAGFAMAIASVVLSAIHFALFFLIKSTAAIWIIEALIFIGFLVYAYCNGLLN